MIGTLLGICICHTKGDPMQSVEEVQAIAGCGLAEDRYTDGNGSWNKGEPGKRQVTLINSRFFSGTNFTHADSRRNLLVEGIELMWHIDREFQIGRARFRGLKYCDPCVRPSTLSGKDGFREQFFDCAGLIAEVTVGGLIKVGDPIIHARRNSELRSVEEELLGAMSK